MSSIRARLLTSICHKINFIIFLHLVAQKNVTLVPTEVFILNYVPNEFQKALIKIYESTFSGLNHNYDIKCRILS